MSCRPTGGSRASLRSAGPLTSAFIPSSKPAPRRAGKGHPVGKHDTAPEVLTTAKRSFAADSAKSSPTRLGKEFTHTVRSRPGTPPLPSSTRGTLSSPHADLLGAPSPSPRSRRPQTSRSGSPSPSSKSPAPVTLGVRTDPDQPGKMWLLLSPSKATQRRRKEEKRREEDEGVQVVEQRVTLSSSPEVTVAGSRKRRRVIDADKQIESGYTALLSPTLAAARPKQSIGQMLMRRDADEGTSQPLDLVDEDLNPSSPRCERNTSPVLSPGRRLMMHQSTAGKRLKPSALLDDDTFDHAQSEAPAQELLTTKEVRESANGLALPTYATPHGPAVFRTPSSGPRLSLTQRARTSLAPNQSSSRVGLDFSVAHLPYKLSPHLPLPRQYATLLALHSALEHALVAHLAVKGPGGSADDAPFGPVSPQPDFGRGRSKWDRPGSSDAARPAEEASSASDVLQGEDGAEKKIRLPGLLTYGALRPVVERASGRDFTPTQLALLARIWSQDGRASRESNCEEEGEACSGREQQGIGLLLSRTRTLDSRGRKCWDWAIGIEMSLSRGRAQARTPPLSLHTPFAPAPAPATASTTPSTPPPRARNALATQSSAAKPLECDSPISSPKRAGRGQQVSGAAAGREGMSIIALWNMGLEARKRAFKERLAGHVARAHAHWMDKARASGVDVEMQLDGEGTLSGWNAAFPLEETPLPPACALPELKAPLGTSAAPGIDRLRPGMAGVRDQALSDGSTPSLIRNEGRGLVPGRPGTVGGVSGSGSGTRLGTETVVAGPSGTPKKLSLEERIRAKQEAKRDQLQGIAQRRQLFAPLDDGMAVRDRKDVPSTPSSRGGGSVFAPSPSRRSESAHADLGLDLGQEQERGQSGAQDEPLDNQTIDDVFGTPMRMGGAASAAGAGALGPGTTSAELMAHFARRSTLSRLIPIAEGLWLLFLSHSSTLAGSSSSSLGASTNSRTAALPLEQVLESVRKSCPNALSVKEAHDALRLLKLLVPGFASCVRSGKREWVRLDRIKGLQDVRSAVQRELQR